MIEHNTFVSGHDMHGHETCHHMHLFADSFQSSVVIVRICHLRSPTSFLSLLYILYIYCCFLLEFDKLKFIIIFPMFLIFLTYDVKYNVCHKYNNKVFYFIFLKS